MSNSKVSTHFVEYLGMQAAQVVRPDPQNPTHVGEDVVIVTVRPEPGQTFRSHNWSISKRQAQRMLVDLQTLMRDYFHENGTDAPAEFC